MQPCDQCVEISPDMSDPYKLYVNGQMYMCLLGVWGGGGRGGKDCCTMYVRRISIVYCPWDQSNGSMLCADNCLLYMRKNA